MENTEIQNSDLKQQSLFKIAMTYGAIIGGAIVLFNLLLYAFGMTFARGLSSFQYAILVAGIYIGTKRYRNNFKNGYITYSQSLGFGVLISVFTGLIAGFFSYFLYTYIDPALYEKAIELQQEILLNKGLSESDVETQTQLMYKLKTPLFLSLSGICSFSIIGLVITLFTSLGLKKDPPPFE